MAIDPPVAPDPAGAHHAPVLLAEVLQLLSLQPGSRTIDCTLGGGGHTAAILERTAPGGVILGLDADPAALRRTGSRLAAAVAEGRLQMVQAPFRTLDAVAQEQGFAQVDAILLDLGVSSFQLQTGDRGFSFATDGPLDMRFDPTQGLSAADIVNEWPEAEIANLIYRYGEEHRSRAIARQIVRQRPIRTTAQLAQVVERAVGGRRGSRIHPATQTFQALRLAVNEELEQLQETLPQALALLKPGGRIAVISFHSLEDRVVKQWMVHEARSWTPDPMLPQGGRPHEPLLTLITRKPVTPGAAELAQNPRSRSAKLRVAARVGGAAPEADDERPSRQADQGTEEGA
jgi:16S rRNA (cytosine1402-N4)-methyltransferase